MIHDAKYKMIFSIKHVIKKCLSVIQFTKEIIIGQSVVYHFAQSYWAPGLALPDIYDFKNVTVLISQIFATIWNLFRI